MKYLRILQPISEKIKLVLKFTKKLPRSVLIIGLPITAYLMIGLLIGYRAYRLHDRSPWVVAGSRVYPWPAIIVDGRYVTLLSVYQQVQYIEHFSQKTGQTVGDSAEIRQKVLDRLIENAAIQATAKQTRLRVTDQEVQEALDKVIKDNGGEKAVVEVLQSLYGMTIPQFKKLIGEQLLKQKVREQALTRVQVHHVLINDEKRARDTLDKIKSGGSFDQLAKELSEDSNSRDKGGDLGLVNRGQLPKEVEEAAFALKPGELGQDIVKSSLGFHIIRVEARNSGKIDLTYDDFTQQFRQKHRIIRFLK